MNSYPEEKNYTYDKNYFTDGTLYAFDAHCESQDIFRCQAEMIEDTIGSFKDKKMLDVGGALGWFAKRCQDRGAIVSCQDISQWACENSPIPEQMRCGDIGEKILFEDNSFDIVTAIEMLEHVNDVKHCLSEVSRVLKHNGLFYCSVGGNKRTTGAGHIWVGTIEDWEKLINDTPELSVNRELTIRMRTNPYCILQRWRAIVTRKV